MAVTDNADAVFFRARRFATLLGHEKRSLASVPDGTKHDNRFFGPRDERVRSLGAQAPGALHTTHFEGECPEERPSPSNTSPRRRASSAARSVSRKALSTRTGSESAVLSWNERGDMNASDVIWREIRRMGRRDPAQR